jgi:hypothetical protein
MIAGESPRCACFDAAGNARFSLPHSDKSLTISPPSHVRMLFGARPCSKTEIYGFEPQNL